MTKRLMKTRIFSLLAVLVLVLACMPAAAHVDEEAIESPPTESPPFESPPFESPTFTSAPIELDPTVKTSTKSLNLDFGPDSAPDYVAASDLSLRLRRQWCRRGYKMCIYKKLCRVTKVKIRVCIKKYARHCLHKTCCRYVFRYRSVRKCHWVTVRCYKYCR